MNQRWVRFLPQFIRTKVEGRQYLQNVISNMGWFFADNFLRMVVGLLIGIWLARYLGPSKFGLFSYALAFAYLFSPLASLGLDDIAVRNLVRDPESKEQILGTAFNLKMIGGALSFVAAIGAIVLLRPDDSLSHWLVGIIAGGSVFQAFCAIDFWFNSQVQSKYSLMAKNAAFLLCAVLKIGCIIAEASLITFAWISTFEIAIGSAALVFAYITQGNRLKAWCSSFKMAWNLLADSWPLIFSCIVINIYMRIDQVMLGEMIGSEEVGIYSVAVRMAEIWFFIPTAIYWSVFPSIVEAKGKNEQLFYSRLQQYYNLMALLAYLVVIPVAILAQWLVGTLFGEEYARAGIMLAILIWANLFTYLEIARSAFFTAMNWNRYYLATLSLGALVNIGLNYFLIPKYGGQGAALSSVFSYWFAAHGACFLFKPLRKTAVMLAKAIVYPKIWQ